MGQAEKLLLIVRNGFHSIHAFILGGGGGKQDVAVKRKENDAAFTIRVNLVACEQACEMFLDWIEFAYFVSGNYHSLMIADCSL